MPSSLPMRKKIIYKKGLKQKVKDLLSSKQTVDFENKIETSSRLGKTTFSRFKEPKKIKKRTTSLNNYKIPKKHSTGVGVGP